MGCITKINTSESVSGTGEILRITFIALEALDIHNNLELSEYALIGSDGLTVLLSSNNLLAHDENVILPTSLVLEENYPNPFNPATTIRYFIPESMESNLLIYNIAGQTVWSSGLVSTPQGWHELTWNGVDQNGNEVSSGIYFYALKAEGSLLKNKMIFLK